MRAKEKVNILLVDDQPGKLLSYKGFGCGMWIMTTFFRYLEWKYWHGAPLTTDTLFRDVVQYPLPSGVFFGVIGWFTRSGNSTK